MAGFDVEPGELFAAEAMVDEAAVQGRADLARLQASAHDLLGYGWSGAAASAFGGGWHEWDEGAALMLRALEEMSRALGVTAREYAQSESINRARFEQLAS